ncbi:acyltransferase [Massilia aurea]|uniref:acyltransferase family protein n=1 Tax=Massilia aurea TaxID=373040 RepID=UPI0034623188
MKTTFKRYNNFNLIRLLLALLVILGHSPELIDGNRGREWLTQFAGTISIGEFAVDCFFLLSGFLITQSWDMQPHPWLFLKKRILRIYPAFIVASVISVFIVGPLAATPAAYFASLDAVVFVRDLLLLRKPAASEVFAGMPYPLVNGAMWTIAREFACYLLILGMGVSGLLRRRHVLLAVTGFVFAVLIWFKLHGDTVVGLRLASFFLSGACYYHYRDRVPYRGGIAAAAAIVLLVCMFSWRGAEIGLATVGGYVLLYLAFKHSTLFSRFNRLPDVSYGVYLYGWPIQKLLLWYIPSLTPWSLFFLAAPAALLVGTVSWYLIEQPALRLKGAPLPILPDHPRHTTP